MEEATVYFYNPWSCETKPVDHCHCDDKCHDQRHKDCCLKCWPQQALQSCEDTWSPTLSKRFDRCDVQQQLVQQKELKRVAKYDEIGEQYRHGQHISNSTNDGQINRYKYPDQADHNDIQAQISGNYADHEVKFAEAFMAPGTCFRFSAALLNKYIPGLDLSRHESQRGQDATGFNSEHDVDCNHKLFGSILSRLKKEDDLYASKYS